MGKIQIDTPTFRRILEVQFSLNTSSVQKQPQGYPRFNEWLDQVDPLRRIAFSKSRVLIKAFKKSRLNVNLDLDNRLRIIMARWLHLPNNTVPLGIPEPHRTIQSDASGSGIGFMINSAK